MEKKHLTRDKIIGKQVIDSEATIIGTVKDLSFDLVASEIALTITTKAGTEINVASEDVRSIGDVILLNKTVEIPEIPRIPIATTPPPEPPPPRTPGLCPECGYQNEPSDKFCIKCGSKL